MKKAVLALGGNALIQEGQKGNVHEQFANTRMSLDGAVELLRQGFSVVLTHGNGPQAGSEMLKNEIASSETPALPLGVIVAETQGFIGYMIAQSMMNRLKQEGIEKNVSVVITQVLVSKDDPSILNPTKFVGKFYTESDIEDLQQRGWQIKKDAGRGYRRVVPSPDPIDIIEKQAINNLLEQGDVVVAVGGGGIPVYMEHNGILDGMDAVIDKDKASSLLARQIGAEKFYIMTAEKHVCINYRKHNEKTLSQITLSEARRYMREGQFPAGSMGPKIDSMINYVEQTGNEGRIGSIDLAKDVIKGKSGTAIITG